jgi:hypothetical protein
MPMGDLIKLSLIKSNFICHVPNTTNCEMLTYKHLTKNAFQEKEFKKWFYNKKLKKI